MWEENRNNSDQWLAPCSDAIRCQSALASPVRVCDHNLKGRRGGWCKCVGIWALKSSVTSSISGRNMQGQVWVKWGGGMDARVEGWMHGCMNGRVAFEFPLLTDCNGQQEQVGRES